MSGLPSRPVRRRSAVTLLELLVAIAVAGMVGGVVVRIFLETDRATRRLSEGNALLEETRACLRSIEETLNRQALAVAGADTRVVWEARRFVIPVCNLAGDKGVGTAEIAQYGPTADETGRIDRVRIAADRGSRAIERLGISPDEHEYLVSFQYAKELDGLTPIWVNEMTGGASPRLVKARLIVRQRDDWARRRSIERIFHIPEARP